MLLYLLSTFTQSGQVPIPVPPVLQIHRAINRIMEAANRKPDETRIWDALAKELLLAAKNEVNPVVHIRKMCSSMFK